MSDVTAAAPGEHEFENIYRQNYAIVWRFLFHLGVQRCDVDDAAQNVFVVAHRKLDNFEQRSSMRTWLCGIAWRVARDFRRSNARRFEMMSNSPHGDQDGAGSDSFEGLRQRRKLSLAFTALEALPNEQREVFVLHELEQMTSAEIATLMGTPVNTVRSRLKRARDAFREQVSQLREKGLLDV